MTRERIIDRIKKLKALAGNNSSVEEAALAAERVTDLMFKHKIGMAEVDVSITDDEVSEFDVLADEGGKQRTTWKDALLGGISYANYCKVIYTSSRRSRIRGGKSRPGKLEVFGRKSDIEAVVYLYKLMCTEVNQLCKAGAACMDDELGNVSIREWSNSFRVGAANAIRARMKERRNDHEAKLKAAQQTAATSTALVFLGKESTAVKAYVAKKFPRLRSSMQRPTASQDGYVQGQLAGSRVSLGGSERGKLRKPSTQLEK